jgi:organic radical activating enzyme
MLPPEIIRNIRWGVATNSSSTHSIIHSPEISQTVSDTEIDEYGEFGWEDFIAKTPEAKKLYLLATLADNIPYQYRNMIIFILQELGFEEAEKHLEYMGVDHQSKMSIPKLTNNDIPNLEFYMDYMNYILENDSFIILGGNDNSDGHPLAVEGDNTKNYFEAFRPDDIAFKNGNYWVVISPERKMRIQFQKDEPLKPIVAELIDLKVTDYCDMGCEYCYQGSTPEGLHADFEEIKKARQRLLTPWGTITEFALGGGEPTSHPKFAEILELLGGDYTILNFTTRTLPSSWSPDIQQAVIKHVTGIAYSVENTEQLLSYYKDHIDTLNKPFENNSKLGEGIKFYIHLIPELMTDDELRGVFAEVEKINEDNRWSRRLNNINVTLLGLKTIGRAEDILRTPRPEIIDILMNMRFTPVGIDTKFAYDYKEYLDKYGVDPKLYTTKEGEFSMYIDMIQNKAYKSSYELEHPINITKTLSNGEIRYLDAFDVFKEIREIRE